MVHKLAFIGFGVVGQGLAEILLESEQELKERNNFEYKVVAISDTMKGSVYNPEGLDLAKILKLVKETGKVEGYRGATESGWDSLKTIKESNADMIIEVSWTDLTTGEPAMSHVNAAFESGKHVIMTNKGPIALAVTELLEKAKKHDVELRFEGTVLAGTPAINMGMYNLAGAGITEFQGIMNGTTNYILSEMEKGMDYQEVLTKAQELGYAEADPAGDVEGHDAAGKVVIMTNVLMGKKISKDDIDLEGITKITSEDVEKAKAEGKRWKLIAGCKLLPTGEIEASVKPIMLPLSDPLASVMGATNALTFKTKYVGDITVVGPGAGKLPTGFALLTDILDIARLRGDK
jgi:homoserine dehydrogenase